VRKEMRKQPVTAENQLTFNDLGFNLTRREALLKGQVNTPKPKEFELLLFLGKHSSPVLSLDTILEKVWGGLFRWQQDGGYPCTLVT